MIAIGADWSCFEPGYWEFFDERGKFAENGTGWQIWTIGYDSNIPVVAPKQVLPRLVTVAQQHKIAYFEISARTAVKMALAGELTVQQMERANETNCHIHVSLEIGGQKQMVTIKPEAFMRDHAIVAYDRHGKALPVTARPSFSFTRHQCGG